MAALLGIAETRYELARALLLELISDLRCLRHVFPGHEQELISGSF
jgi:hypothetical protein